MNIFDTDDNSAAGDGVTYWFATPHGDFGLCRGKLDDAGYKLEDAWLDCDGNPLDCAEDWIRTDEQDDALALIEVQEGLDDDRGPTRGRARTDPRCHGAY